MTWQWPWRGGGTAIGCGRDIGYNLAVPPSLIASQARSAPPRGRMAAALGWSRASSLLLSAFVLLLLLMGYVWWPLAEEYLALIDWEGEWWRQIDYLLIGVFAAMSLLIVAHADLRLDGPVILVGLAGGLVIESWGTQTELWTYYTLERPPLWIIPAWPIASLSIERLTRLSDYLLRRVATRRRRPAGDARVGRRATWVGYWLTFAGFYGLMVAFVWPTLDKSFTWLALALCAGLILTPTEPRLALLTFGAGSGLGYFLEVWGTTRLCWSYYTGETPPLFAVLAHGMAAVAFWRANHFGLAILDWGLRGRGRR